MHSLKSKSLSIKHLLRRAQEANMDIHLGGVGSVRWAKENYEGPDDCKKCHIHHTKTTSALGDLALETHRMNELVKSILARDSSPGSSQRDRFALLRQIRLIQPEKRKDVIAFIKQNLQQL